MAAPRRAAARKRTGRGTTKGSARARSPRLKDVRSLCWEIGDRVADIRIAADVTQTALAQRVGVAPATVSSWETGRTFPSPWCLRLLCKEFNCTSDYLLGLADWTYVDGG